MIKIRSLTPDDCAELARLFYDTVQSVNAKDYTQEQLNAWAVKDAEREAWDASLSVGHTLVAEEDGFIAGFGDIDGTGYLNRLYVHRDHQRRGVATALLNTLEKEFQVKRIFTHASITARPFFEKRGYRTVKKQQVHRRGVSLANYLMEKALNS